MVNVAKVVSFPNCIKTGQYFLNCSTSAINFSSKRFTQMFRRKVILQHQPKLQSPFVVGPFLRDPKYKQPRPVADFIYDELENTDDKEDDPLKLILLKPVDELGIAGDIVEVERNYARFHLISSKVATYASEFNLKRFKDLIESGDNDQSAPSSAFVKSTLKQLSNEVIVVMVNNNKPWTITADHIRVSFRVAGYRIENDSIRLPSTPITGPDVEGKQGKDFAVTITINNRESGHVRCMIHHLGLPLRLDWNTAPRFILLPEQIKLLESMPVKEPEESE